MSQPSTVSRASLRAHEPPGPTRPPASALQTLPPTLWTGNQSRLRSLSEAATTLRREPANKDTGLLDRLTARAVEEINHDGSAAVLATIADVARRNHLLRPLALALDAIAQSHGTYLDAFVQTLRTDSGGRFHDIVVEMLAKEGVHREDSPQVMAMSQGERLWAAAFLGAPEVPRELLRQVVASLPWIAGLWAASHFVVLGDIVDLLGIAFLGQMAVQVVSELLDFYNLAKNARNESDLRAAGSHLASVVAMIGVLGLAKLAKRYGSGRKPAGAKGAVPADTAPPPETAPRAATPTIAAPEPAATTAPAAPEPAPTPAPAVEPSGDPSVDDLNLDEAFKEYDGPQVRTPQAPLRDVVTTPEGVATRRGFKGRIRAAAARALGVRRFGQVHHAVEVNVISRYPGVFTPGEINNPANFRGIPPEEFPPGQEGSPEASRPRQLHNSKIREILDRHYRGLDAEIARQGIRPRTPAYNALVRQWIYNAVEEIDWSLGQFFSEQRARYFPPR